MTMKSSILLEVGTNEFEIIELKVGDVLYGVNVAKVREIIFPEEVVEVPKMHESIEGIFYFRGSIIPVINLRNYLSKEPIKILKTDKYIIMEFNQLLCAFRVDEVHRIRKLSWNKIETPSEMVLSDNSSITGVVKITDNETNEEKIIMMLDFEKIIADIEPQTSFEGIKIEENKKIVDRSSKHIIIAEDSKLVRHTIVKTLKESGYSNVKDCKNGLEAWTILKNLVNENIGNVNWRITDEYNLLVTDIEMPQMDGHALTRRVKEEEKLKELPVVIFSSLANEENVKKGISVGADGQIAKPQIDQLVKYIDKIIK